MGPNTLILIIMASCIHAHIDTSALVSNLLRITRGQQENAAERQELSEVTQAQSSDIVFCDDNPRARNALNPELKTKLLSRPCVFLQFH